MPDTKLINPILHDPFTPLVAKILDIEQLTYGTTAKNSPDGFKIRYRGRLYGDSQPAYQQISEALEPYNVTPLFRIEEGKHTILLLDGRVRTKPSKKWVNLLMFLLTMLSVIWVGLNYSFDVNAPTLRQGLLNGLGGGLAYAASLLAILLAHEFGHYLAARHHGTAVTLPYFLPLPLPPFGTLGAFIQMKVPPRNKRVLMDIGLAGPLAGLAVSIPVLFLGLSLSHLDPLPWHFASGISLEGNSIFYILSKYLVFHRWLPEPATFGGMHPALYWLRYFFTGQPAPIGGMDVVLHPVAWAGWAGLLVTALNLIPVGQLDGGHLVYVLFGKKANRAYPYIISILILMALIWSGWWLWAGLLFLFGRFHAEPLDQITPLDDRRRKIAWVGLIIFILIFTPIPLQVF